MSLVSQDEHLSFKLDATNIILRTEDNESAGNLAEGYTRQRGQSLTEQEKRILLNAEWESADDTERFLESMTAWDILKENLPPLGRNEKMVIGIDGATGRANSPSDCFAMVGVTRHPDPKRHNDVAVRFVRAWQAKAGKKIIFEGNPDAPTETLIKLCKDYSVVEIAYDESELRLFAQQLIKKGVGWFRPFSQGTGSNIKPGRGIADKQLLDLIQQKQLAHDGNPLLRQHIDNADRKMDAVDRKIRLVKRVESKKIDLAVALSESTCEVKRLRL